MTGPPARPLRVAYVCKAVNEAHPTVATQVCWVRALAEHPRIERVEVLTPEWGRAELPENVRVTVVPGESWPARSVAFVRRAALVASAVDFFFVAQGGPYPALLLPLRLLRRRPVFHWKAHSHVSWRMRFYATACDDLVFTATPGSLPIDSHKLRVVGHGIDTDRFVPRAAPPVHDVAVVGRVEPIKHVDAVLRAAAAAGASLGRPVGVDVIGPPRDHAYQERLEKLVAELGTADHVRFMGPVSSTELADRLPGYRVAANFSDTAFDKAAGEAMAAGVPLLTTNPRAAEVIPRALHSSLVASPGDPAAQAELLAAVLAWSPDRRAAVGQELCEAVAAGHGVGRLFDAIIGEIDAFLTHGRRR